MIDIIREFSYNHPSAKWALVYIMIVFIILGMFGAGNPNRDD